MCFSTNIPIIYTDHMNCSALQAFAATEHAQIRLVPARHAQTSAHAAPAAPAYAGALPEVLASVLTAQHSVPIFRLAMRTLIALLGKFAPWAVVAASMSA
jgi:hypothetical protein